MEARHLKRLADVAEVSKLDISPGAMTLAPIPGGTVSWYGGAYTAGGIKVAVEHALSEPVSVAALEFRELVNLFEDEMNVVLSVEASALVLKAGKRRVSLRFLSKPDYQQWAELRAVTGASVTASRELFLRELGMASGIAAVTLTNPILTGIRLVAKGGAGGVQAANGSSLVFEAKFAATAGEGSFQALIPAKDIMTVLPVVRDEESLSFVLQRRGETGMSLVIQGASSIVKLAILAGNWPKMEQLKQIKFDEPLSLPIPAIRSLAAATRAYKASNDTIIRPSEEAGFVVLETAEAEMGQFQETLPGSITRTYVLDVGDLETAGKLADGTLDLTLSPNMALCTVGGRSLYINLRTR